jgi:membrane-associated protease RseP (regulator of RpoE activity)
MRYLNILAGCAVLVAALVSAAPQAARASSDTKSVALAPDSSVEKRNKDVIAMAEQFGMIVGPVTEDIRKELNLRSAEGVAVFEVIGDSLAERAGIKVGAVIAEINKAPVRSLDDLGRLLTEALEKGNFTVSTWEPTNPENQGQGGQLNFHFVPKAMD